MSSRTRYSSGTLISLFITGILLGWFIGWSLGRVSMQPYCPTEDSCVVDYRDGEWHIEKVAP